jgi:uridine kinase
MEILIVGRMGVGKSVIGDKIKNQIFKSDKFAAIHIDDPGSREAKTIGNGNNDYYIRVRQTPTQEEEINADIIVNIKTNMLAVRLKELNEQ